MIQLHEPASPWQVGGDRKRGLTAKNVFDEAGQVAAGADIHEEAKTVGVHGLDRFAESHGRRPLFNGQLANRANVIGHRPARRTRIDRNRLSLKRHLAEELGDRANHRSEARGVIGARKRQALPKNALPAQPAHDRLKLSRGDGKHHLVRAIVHGHGRIIGPNVTANRLDTLPIGGGGDQVRHRQVTGSFKAAKDGAQMSKLLLEHPIGRKNPRGGECQQLAAAVANHRVGLQSEMGEKLIHRPLGIQHDVHRRGRRP